MRVHPAVLVGWLRQAVKRFGPITPENHAEVTAWVMAQCRTSPEGAAGEIRRHDHARSSVVAGRFDWHKAAAGDRE